MRCHRAGSCARACVLARGRAATQEQAVVVHGGILSGDRDIGAENGNENAGGRREWKRELTRRVVL